MGVEVFHSPAWGLPVRTGWMAEALNFTSSNLRFEQVALDLLSTLKSRFIPKEPVHHETVHPERAGSNLSREPVDEVSTAEVTVRTCTANRLDRFTGSPEY